MKPPIPLRWLAQRAGVPRSRAEKLWHEVVSDFYSRHVDTARHPRHYVELLRRLEERLTAAAAPAWQARLVGARGRALLPAR